MCICTCTLDCYMFCSLVYRTRETLGTDTKWYLWCMCICTYTLDCYIFCSLVYRTRETLATGNLLSVINVLMQLRKVCNHPNLFEVRPTISPFQMEGITYETASLVMSALDYNPFKVSDIFEGIGMVDLKETIEICRYWVEHFLVTDMIGVFFCFFFFLWPPILLLHLWKDFIVCLLLHHTKYLRFKSRYTRREGIRFKVEVVLVMLVVILRRKVGPWGICDQ